MEILYRDHTPVDYAEVCKKEQNRNLISTLIIGYCRAVAHILYVPVCDTGMLLVASLLNHEQSLLACVVLPAPDLVTDEIREELEVQTDGAAD